MPIPILSFPLVLSVIFNIDMTNRLQTFQHLSLVTLPRYKMEAARLETCS
ncbi:hypothetical protein JHK84_031525 [Glycine max]|nr:hypothetical protein JHK84_031525 [Glycine max]